MSSSIGAGGWNNGGIWGGGGRPFRSNQRRTRKGSSTNSSNSPATTGGPAHSFPLKQAVTAGSLALTGDTIAQLRSRWLQKKALQEEISEDSESHDFFKDIVADHNWLRALRMSSYGFLIYGPGSYAWYQFLDRCMPKQSVQSVLTKVLLNQIVLGPCVIAVVFAWNNLWQGKLSELPNKYQKDALPTLLFGFRFWIPVSILNFWVIPLQARVAFMSMGSIFWNFCLSSTMSK